MTATEHLSSLVRSNSAWGAEQIANYLATAEQPLRLALQSGDAPLVIPLWFQFVEDAFYCACSKHAKVVELIRQAPLCGFDVSTNAMPYKGVRGQGAAEVLPEQGEPALQALVERYLKNTNSGFAQWLLSRSADEVAIIIRPQWMTAWDFSARMTAD